MKKETLENTTNRRTYKALLWQKNADELRLCQFCGPHTGCNFWNKKHDLKNWKKYRYKQYRNMENFTKQDLINAFSDGVQIGADYGEDGEKSVNEDFNKWFDNYTKNEKE